MSKVEELEASGEILSPAARAVIEALEASLTAVLEELRELKAQLKQNSTNSSKPPSSDPPGVKRAERKPTGKKRGGQPGHRGHYRKQVPVERVDEVVEHVPSECRHCHYSLEGAKEAKPDYKHQVVELPEIRAEVTEHRMKCLRCPRCRKVTRAPLPAEVGGKHFGPRLVAFLTQLIGRYRVSRREAVALVSRMLDVPAPSLGSTEAFAQESSKALKPAYEEARAEVLQSPSAGVDETPWKLNGKKHWLWVAVTGGAVFFHLGKGRGSKELERFLGAYEGTVNSDRWCAYQLFEKRQLCWAHLIRNFKRFELRGPEAARFAESGVAECAKVFDLWWAMREGRLTREQLRSEIEPVQKRLRALLEDGATWPHKKVSGFCRNVLKLWASLWTFVEEPVEPTNNAAERALRPAVLWRKSCFGSQSEAGLRFAERALTFNATCRLHGLNPFEILAHALLALREGSPAPTLLPTG